MKATRLILILPLFLGGCSSCQHEEAPAGGGGATAPQTTVAVRAGGTASGTSGKIQVAPLAPTTVARPGGAASGETGAVGAGAPRSAPPPEPEKSGEGDCIVVIDGSPDYGPPPLAVAFTAEAECSAGQPTYQWDFGDGSPPSPEANPSHTYMKPGDYTASVTVNGPNGATATDELDITVEEGEALAQ